MSPIAVVSFIVVFAAAVTIWARRSERFNADNTLSQFDALAPRDGLDAGMARLARPVSKTRAVAELAESPLTRTLKERLTASRLYGGNIDIFLSYQLAAIFIGCAIESLALLTGLPTIARIAFALLGVAISGWPYNKVMSATKKRAGLATEQLPDFVDVLQIALASSMSIRPALNFAVSQMPDGPVSEEARWLSDTLASGSMSEADAYAEAGRRIGSPEASAFFASLGQSAVSGARIVDSLRRQSEMIRSKTHQMRRAKIKKVPVTLVIAFTLHFLPLLFVVSMTPLLLNLSGM